MEEFRVGILTVSDKGSRGEREDLGGPLIKEMIASIGGRVEVYEIVPDVQEKIAEKLIDWSDRLCLALILTTGGTGFSPRDVTPEATRSMLHRLAPGIAEAMRAEGMKKTPAAMLSRGVAGLRGSTLIINLPGSVKGVRESLEAVLPALPHALAVSAGQVSECGKQ